MSISPSGQQSRHTKRKAWDSNPHPREGAPRLANRPGQPYPATFRNSVDPTGNRTRISSHAELVSSRWTMSPFRRSGPAGESNPRTDLGANQVVFRWTSQPTFERSVRESNPVFLLTAEVCCQNTYRPIFKVIPAGVEPSLSWLSPRRLCRWTTGSLSVTEVGVEPTESRGSRPRRFASLRTRSWRVRGSHPAVQAYEARLSTGPPASSCRPRYRTGRTGLMGASWAPAAPAMCQ